MENIVPDFKNLNSHPPGTKASVAQPKANGAKTTSQKKNATENDYSFLFVDARFGGAGGAYNGGNDKRKKDGNKKQRREILQTTRIQMMMMMMKTVKMITLQMLMDKSCQETTLANKPPPS